MKTLNGCFIFYRTIELIVNLTQHNSNQEERDAWQISNPAHHPNHFVDRVWGSLDSYIPPLPPLTASPGTSRSRDRDVPFLTPSTPSSFIFKDVPDPRCPRSVLLFVTGLLASLGNRRELWKEPGCPAVLLGGTRRAASLMSPERVPRLVEISLCCSSSSRLDRMSPFF